MQNDKMKGNALVSIITPVHNSATFVHRLLDSVLDQTYPNIEMIIVDNDSKDETPTIIASYSNAFKDKGYTLQYIHEDDMGPSYGLQTGMRAMHGDYVTFPDSDDYYEDKAAIITMVEKFESLPKEYAVVRSLANKINEEDMTLMGIFGENQEEGDSPNIFNDCLEGNSDYYYVNIALMIRTSALNEYVGLEFFTHYRFGPGRQVLLPLYYSQKCYTIKKVLCNYLVRKKSISHGDYANIKVQCELYASYPQYYRKIFSSIKEMPISEKRRYYKESMTRETQRTISFMLQVGEKSKAIKYSFYLFRYAESPWMGIKRVLRKLHSIYKG